MGRRTLLADVVNATCPDALDSAIMAAHEADDRHRLSALYLQAGELKLAAGDVDAACFLFTQSYVYGLDGGNDEASRAAHQHLIKHGRDS
jgi:hypothetical protein